MLLPFEEVRSTLYRILLNAGFSSENADLMARIFTESNRDGYASHGINRVPLFIRGIRQGYINPEKIAENEQSFGALERWNGNGGAGILNASICMDRAMKLAGEQGIGCVALRNTNHWMRGGTYGWQAIDAGFGAICWTNTIPNMPPWGGRKSHTGNNPIVLAIPGPENMPLVLDMALSQYSYGKLDTFRRQGKKLPFPGGYSKSGILTVDPDEILESGCLLPAGLWKGSGLSLMLDLFAALLSAGQASVHIGNQDYEYGLSQVFIAFKLESVVSVQFRDNLIREVAGYFKDSSKDIWFPGERTLIRRQRASARGIEVDPDYWNEIFQLG
jgi:3-dehydro-L-gulonate 2-dehydrogenase